MAIYIPEYKTLYIHISKTGGTSVTEWITENFTSSKVKKKHSRFLDVQRKVNFDYAFSICRNPYSRLYSWYSYRLKKAYNDNDIPGNKEFMLYCEHNKGFDTFVFESDKTPGPMNSIWWTQEEFISPDVDMLRMENLKNEFKVIQNRLHCKKDLKNLNTSNSYNYKSMYSADTKKFVQTYFKNDFKLFNYNIDL